MKKRLSQMTDESLRNLISKARKEGHQRGKAEGFRRGLEKAKEIISKHKRRRDCEGMLFDVWQELKEIIERELEGK